MTAPIDQMRLPLQSDLPDGAEGFVVSDCNRAAVEAVADWPNLIGGVMAICGPAGCGKSRLGQIWAERVGAVAIHGGEAAVIDPMELEGRPVLLDRAVDADDETLFHLINLAQAPGGALLLLQAPFKEVERGLRELAQSQAAVLWVGEGPREEVQKDLEEALLLGPLLRLPPGLYPVRFLWPLSLALESRRGQERLLRLVRPLEGQPDLLKTLEAYLGARLSLKAAARRLGLNPNTVLYRLHRVEELTGLSLERVEDLCLLQIALQLREALTPGPPG